MKRWVLISLGILGLGLLAYGTDRYILGGPRSPLMGFNAKLQDEYHAIKLGDSFSEVKKQLGEPARSGDTLLLPQRQGREESFDEAERSGATIYYLWINGGNWFYSIGFDVDEKVVVKAEGNS